ncbi:MAG: hypothetical protein VX874_16920 [Pseudomonadota bacterium]|nr:hypothetical protein [Pseudomonadota bacterium]
MQISDVIFYGLGAAVVVGISGLVDFGSLFGAKSDDTDSAEPDTSEAPAEPASDHSERGEYQSTLAFFLEEDHDSLVSARQDEDRRGAVVEPEPDAPEAVEPDETFVVASTPDSASDPADDDNIFGDVTVTDEDTLYEAQEQAAAQAPLAIYDLTDPASEAAYLDDFDEAEEVIRIEYVPSFDPDTGQLTEPEVSVAYDEDLDLTTIALDGATVAELDGEVPITARDIELVPMEAEAYAA